MSEFIKNWLSTTLSDASKYTESEIVIFLAGVGTFFSVLVWLAKYLYSQKYKKIDELLNTIEPAYNNDLYKNAQKYYVDPSYSFIEPDAKEEEDIGISQKENSMRISKFLVTDFLHEESNQFVLLLGTSGIGKTTLAIRIFRDIIFPFYWKFKWKILVQLFAEPQDLVVLRRLASIDEREKIAKLAEDSQKNKHEKTVILDGFDEYPVALKNGSQALEELLYIYKTLSMYKNVIITCREQFLSDILKTNKHKLKITTSIKTYQVQKIYLTGFTQKQEREYIQKRFGHWGWLKKIRTSQTEQRAYQILDDGNLRGKDSKKNREKIFIRPLILSYITELLDNWYSLRREQIEDIFKDSPKIIEYFESYSYENKEFQEQFEQSIESVFKNIRTVPDLIEIAQVQKDKIFEQARMPKPDTNYKIYEKIIYNLILKDSFSIVGEKNELYHSLHKKFYYEFYPKIAGIMYKNYVENQSFSLANDAEQLILLELEIQEYLNQKKPLSKNFELKNNSLLGLDGNLKYRFLHQSIFEFFLANDLYEKLEYHSEFYGLNDAFAFYEYLCKSYTVEFFEIEDESELEDTEVDLLFSSIEPGLLKALKGRPKLERLDFFHSFEEGEKPRLSFGREGYSNIVQALLQNHIQKIDLSDLGLDDKQLQHVLNLFPELVELDLRKNRILDISFLKNFTKLKSLDLDENPLDPMQALGLCRNRADLRESIFSAVDSKGNTVLLNLIADLDLVLECLDLGADVNGDQSLGGTALMVASKNGHLSVVECLLERGASVDKTNKEGVTALMVASQNGHLSVVLCIGRSIVKNLSLSKEQKQSLFNNSIEQVHSVIQYKKRNTGGPGSYPEIDSVDEAVYLRIKFELINLKNLSS